MKPAGSTLRSTRDLWIHLQLALSMKMNESKQEQYRRTRTCQVLYVLASGQQNDESFATVLLNCKPVSSAAGLHGTIHTRVKLNIRSRAQRKQDSNCQSHADRRPDPVWSENKGSYMCSFLRTGKFNSHFSIRPCFIRTVSSWQLMENSACIWVCLVCTRVQTSHTGPSLSTFNYWYKGMPPQKNLSHYR